MADYTRVNLLDLEDSARTYGMPEPMSARFATGALELEKSGLSLQSYGPDFRGPFGHRHRDEEETYVVLEGSGRIAIGDDVVGVARLDAIRVAPKAVRAIEAGSEGITILAFGAPGLGASDAEQVPGWWPAD